MRVIATGTINLGGGDRDCYVLEDGTPLLGTSEVQAILGAPGKGGLGRLVSRIPSNNGQLSLPPIALILPSGIHAHGYNAEDVIDICLAYQDALLAGTLHHTQVEIAKRAAQIVRATAKTGVRALVYEATGYIHNPVRPADDFQTYYSKVVREDPMPWAECFDAEWDRLICRLWRHAYDGRPPRFGARLNRLAYDCAFGKPLTRQLKESNPDPRFGSNHHQYLQPQARIKLSQTIQVLKGIIKTSRTTKDFWHKVQVVFSDAPFQEEFAWA